MLFPEDYSQSAVMNVVLLPTYEGEPREDLKIAIKTRTTTGLSVSFNSDDNDS
jgi:hypothetical protein